MPTHWYRIDASRTAAARRHANAISATALVLLGVALLGGVVLVASLGLSPQQGLLYGLVPAVAGTLFTAVHAVGELTWPRPSGAVRRAPLVRRTVADVAPGRLRLAVWVTAALLGATLVVCGLLSDDGRTVTRSFPDGDAGAGPFPGWFYGVPLIIAAAVVLLAGEGVLRLIAARPAVMDAAVEWDLGLRRLSAHRLLRGVQVVLGVTTAAVLLVAGSALRSVGIGGTVDGVSTSSAPWVAAGFAVLALGLATGAATLTLTAAPAPPPPLPAPGPAPVDAATGRRAGDAPRRP